MAAIPGDSKKRVLELIARTLHQAHPILDEEEIFDRLIERERLGSTGIGDGVAIIQRYIKIGQGAEYGTDKDGLAAKAAAQYGPANGCAKRGLSD